MSISTEARRTTGWVLLETIANYGVDTVFGIPGTHNLELYRPLRALNIRVVTSRHEQGAGYAADAWAQRTRKPGVVITTSGPGLLNALSAAGTAFCESRPMIILAPGPALGDEFADRGALHETKDQLGAAQAIVEKAARVTSAAEAVDAVHEAFALFTQDRPRPVYIEIPLDVLESITDIDAERLQAQTPPAVTEIDATAVSEAAQLLAEASQPVILAGGGSRHAAAEIQRLAEALVAPVVTTGNGKGTLSEKHPLSLGSLLRLEAVREVAQHADVLLVVGSKLGEADLWVDRLNAQGKVIRVDLLESQLNKNQDAHLGITGDSREVLQAVNTALEDLETVARNADEIHDRVAAARAAAREQSQQIDAENCRLGEWIAQALPEDAIVASDSSQIAYLGLIDAVKATEPNSVMYMPTYATLGYGTPGGIGAKLASPERPVAVVTGDGALMFSFNEFLTAVEQQLDLVVIVVDNGGYAEIQANEADVAIAPIGVQLTQPDWPLLAEALGGRGHRVTEPAQLESVCAEAFAAGGLQLIHIDQDLIVPKL